MIPEFTIVTAVTKEYINHLFWSISSWPFKPQLRNRPLIVFYHGIKEKDIKFVYKVYPNAKLIEWNMLNIESKSELMFSSFVFGARHIKTPYFMKLDADAFCTSTANIWEESDFQYDIIGHKWNYTKPGWFIDKLECYYGKEIFNWDNRLSNSKRYEHKRFESYCCLHRTDWVKKISDKLTPRLPVPSHDTTLWFYADKEGKWGRKNIKKCGVDNSSKWKNIREVVCSGDMAFNPLLNGSLLSNIQLEITSRCNLGCNQCDRNCGLVPPGNDMEISQIWRLIEWALNNNHQFKRIDVIGGEPTLYKKLNTVFDLIKLYKDKYPRCKVRFSTNGLAENIDETLKTIPDWVHIRNSSKKSKYQCHTAYRCAPIDLGETNIKACSVPWRCGLGFTRYGVFPCGAGASLARVFGFDIGIKDLSELTPANIKKQMIQLCKYCGHSNCSTRKMAEGNELTSSWENAVKNYNIEKMSEF